MIAVNELSSRCLEDGWDPIKRVVPAGKRDLQIYLGYILPDGESATVDLTNFKVELSEGVLPSVATEIRGIISSLRRYRTAFTSKGYFFLIKQGFSVLEKDIV